MQYRKLDLLGEVLSIEVLFIVKAKYNLADYNSNCLSPLLYLIKIMLKRILSSFLEEISAGRFKSRFQMNLLFLMLTDGSVVLSSKVVRANF